MSNRFKVSIALCTYNGAHFILEQLESIAAQTYLPDEVIICDDGSTDGTLSIATEFANTAPFLIISHKNFTKLGVTKNFERAISLCSGDIIFLCDQDDVWMPQKIEIMISAFQANDQVGLVFSNGYIVDSKLNKLGYMVWDVFGVDKYAQHAITGNNPLSFLIRHYAITGATMAFHTRLKNEFLPIPAVWIHDAWIACLAASLCSIAIVIEPLILYRQHEGNVIGGKQLSLHEKIHHAHKKPSTKTEKEISRFLELHHKLQGMVSSKVTLRHLNDIQNKIQHLKSRREVYSHGFVSRTPIVVRELFNLGYFKFSRGLGSALTDLILRNRTD